MYSRHEYKKGLSAALLCSTLWGILPIYWSSLEPIDSFVVIMYRILLLFLSCLIPAIYLKCKNKTELFGSMTDSANNLFRFACAGILIGLNWSIYIWAVSNGQVIQTAMGYFLEPIVVCIFGLLFFNEKLNIYKLVALIFATVGLLVMIIGYRQLPAVALGLALTFAIYAAIKKNIDATPLQSLLGETLFVVPVAVIGIIYFEATGKGVTSNLQSDDFYKLILLMFSGLVTGGPLLLFAYGAQRLPLFTLGISEYISPTLSLIIGIFFLKENFSMIQLYAFIIIWIGLFFFTVGEFKAYRKRSEMAHEIEEAFNKGE